MKRSKLIQIIKEEIESVLLEQNKSTVTPEVALQMLVKAIGPLKNSDNKPLNVGQLLKMDGLHNAVAKASAFYPLDRLVAISKQKMKAAEKDGITGKVASDLAKELFDMVRNQEAKANKPNKPQQQTQQGQSVGQVKNNQFVTVHDHAAMVSANANPAGQKKMQQLTALATQQLKAKRVKPINLNGKLAFVPLK